MNFRNLGPSSHCQSWNHIQRDGRQVVVPMPTDRGLDRANRKESPLHVAPEECVGRVVTGAGFENVDERISGDRSLRPSHSLSDHAGWSREERSDLILGSVADAAGAHDLTGRINGIGPVQLPIGAQRQNGVEVVSSVANPQERLS